MEMKTILLSSFGFSNYAITESGRLYKLKPSHKELKTDCKNCFYLIDDKGKEHRTPLKKIYRKVFNKEYCIDTIENLPLEQWKEIPKTSGKYFVSNCGRVKSYCGYSAIIL